MDYTLNIYTNLNSKYQNKFNFYFSKSINQIVFNQTTAISTIEFKDAAIYAESIQYLKRQYFLINQIGIEEIFQRINMLAGFYAGAILLRYEYPSMIITNTKQIFLKRLKRNKKMLTEEGSSDQSDNQSQSRQVQLHTNKFLSSVNSSELSKKTLDFKDDQFPQVLDRQHDKSYDSELHDIHNPISVKNDDDQLSPKLFDESFAQKLLRLSKNVSLNELVASQTIQINLQPNQSEISHLLFDFDDIDNESILKNYKKLKSRQKQNLLSFGIQFPEIIEGNFRDFKKKLKSTNQIDEMNGYIFQNYEKLNQPTENYLHYRKKINEMKFSQILDSNVEGRRTKMYTEYEKNSNFNAVKKSAFYETKRSHVLNDYDDQIPIVHSNRQLKSNRKYLEARNPQETFQNQYLFDFPSSQHKMQTERKFPKNVAERYKNYESIYLKEQKQSRSTLQRHRSNNVIGLAKQAEIISRHQQNVDKILKSLRLNPSKRHINDEQKFPNRFEQMPYISTSKSPNYYESQNRKYINHYNNIQQRDYYSPKFKEIRQQQEQNLHQNTNMHSFQKANIHSVQNRNDRFQTMPSIDQVIIKNSQIYQSSNNQNHIKKHTQTNAELEYFEEKQEKKKKIREKAAQLLHRVRSQEYLTGRSSSDFMSGMTKNY